MVVGTRSEGCQQGEEGVLSVQDGLSNTPVDRNQQAKIAAVLEAKTQVWGEFWEAMENDYRQPRNHLGKPSGVGSSSLPMLSIVGMGTF